MQPILAAGEFVTIIMFVLMGIGWLFQQLTAKNEAAPPKGPRPRPPRRPPNDRLQDEIEIFINDVKRQKGPEAGRRDNIPQPPQRPKPKKNNSQQQKKAQPNRVAPVQSSSVSATAPRPAPLGNAVSSRHLSSGTDLGSEVRDHARTFLREGDVDASVKMHLGAAELPAKIAEAPINAPQIRALLCNPIAVRQAMILNELLEKPLALRRKN